MTIYNYTPEITPWYKRRLCQVADETASPVMVAREAGAICEQLIEGGDTHTAKLVFGSALRVAADLRNDQADSAAAKLLARLEAE